MERIALISEVKTLIDAWLVANTTRNMSAFARESGVSESCVRRLYNNSSVPNNDNLLKMLTALSGHKSIEGLKKHFESQVNICSFLLSNYSFLETSTHLSNGQPLLSGEVFIEDYHAFLVYAFASNRTPISKEDVTKMFGMIGETALETLTLNDLIRINGSNYLEVKVSNIRPSKELVKKHLPDICRMFFKPDSLFNGYILQTETISKKGYGLVMDAFDKFLASVGEAIQNNPGEVPLVVAGFMDTLTLKPYFKEESK